MNRLLFLTLALLITSCQKQDQNSSPQSMEEGIGLSEVSECGRVKEIYGSNNLYQWEKAQVGDLQQITVHRATQSIRYVEARTGGVLRGESRYRFSRDSLFFKTTTKSLKLTFPEISFGIIDADGSDEEYKVGILNYHDGSGTRAFFLCQMK